MKEKVKEFTCSHFNDVEDRYGISLFKEDVDVVIKGCEDCMESFKYLFLKEIGE